MTDWIGWMSSPEAWASLMTLTVLEIVLGIDNIIFLSLIASKLPTPELQKKARQGGLALALITRLMLLASIAWIARMTEPVFTLFDHGVSLRDLVLGGGGLFLIYKATIEIHDMIEGEDGEAAIKRGPKHLGLVAAMVQISILDIVFSLDSVITAVGMSQHLPVMMTAVVIAVIVMLFAAGPVSDFVNRHPTVKMLALAFLLMVGLALVADGMEFHIPKGYLYAAMAFSMLVEALNLWARRKQAAKSTRADGNGSH